MLQINQNKKHVTQKQGSHLPFSCSFGQQRKFGRTCFHQVEMPTKEAKEDDAHDATQNTNEDHHALAEIQLRGVKRWRG